MANGEDDALEVEGFGVKGRLRGKRLLGENTLLFVFFCALAFFGYKHHVSNEEAIEKLREAVIEQTYVLSLAQPEREALKIALPESLRRKLRRE